MLTRFFGNSKPINFLLTGAFLFLIFIGYELKNYSDQTDVIEYSLHGAVFVLILFSLFLLDFIIRKNSLCLSNNYSLLLFAVFVTMIPAIFGSMKIATASVMLMLAFRRIISLQNNANSERKIFDASLWICLASLFYFWGILMLIPLYLAILSKSKTQFRYFLIPPIGIFTVFILTTTFYLLKDDSMDWSLSWFQSPGFDFSPYNDLRILTPISVLGAILLWSAFHRIKNRGTVPKKDRPKYFLILNLMITSAVIVLLSPEKNGSEFILSLPFIAIISANYLESVKELFFKEALLWITVLVPLALFFLF